MIRPITPAPPRHDHAIEILAGHAALGSFAASMAIDAPHALAKMRAWHHLFNAVAIANHSRTYNGDSRQECELLVTQVLPTAEAAYDAANVELSSRNWRGVTDPRALADFERFQVERDIAADFIGRIKEACRSLGYATSTAALEGN